MDRKIKLVIAYDGTAFHGWQQQPGMRTVQAELEAVLPRVVRHPVELIGASRTDAGVHARGQVAHFRTSSSIVPAKLRWALACRLPPDIDIVHAEEAPPEFHASRSARGKLYRYIICNTQRRPLVTQTRFAWHQRHALDVEAMQAAARPLIGEHDFAAYANRGSRRETTVRRLERITIWRHYENVICDIEGVSFLYNQVRIMVGTLVEVGRGHWPVERVGQVLESRDRSRAGVTAPPEGLSLQWIRYDPVGSVAHAVD